ncbi:MAG: heat-inducible transcription repressor HrcA [Candidatus Sericytochromatia bacterium]|nr:heat-inducible transcription repressor HrcA [Candidatus Sericytochromatia bacterium]
MDLTARQRHILDTIVQDYIRTGEPVGSRTLSKRHGIGLSPATIRNEMAELEENGLLRQPHTSAGRIPSDSGYRVFVEELMGRPTLGDEQRQQVEDSLDRTPREFQALLGQAARVLATMSQCAAIITTPEMQAETIRYVQLVPLNAQALVVVMMTSSGEIRNYAIRLSERTLDTDWVQVTNYLNAHARGLALTEAIQVLAALSTPTDFAWSVREVLGQLWPQLRVTTRVYTWGASLVLKEPEFAGSDRMYALVRWLEQSDEVSAVLEAMTAQHQPVLVSIGHENTSEPLHSCSVVTAPYRAGDAIGTLAVLGPTRMDYAQAYAVVEVVAEHLSQMLSRLTSE